MSEPCIVPPNAEKYWDQLAALLTQARQDLGNETAFSVTLSVTVQQLREAIGAKAAGHVVEMFARPPSPQQP